jgi:hypothetical protein
MGAMTLKTYDPTEQDVIFNGVLVDGFAPGTFIKVSFNEDLWSFQASNSGGGARSRNPNRSGKLEFTLHQSSPSNGILSAFFRADLQSGTGVGECLIKDRSTAAAEVVAQNAWIVKAPDFERGKETGEVTWVLESDAIDIIHDGGVDQA